jgi:transcription initiation factor IIE alpha subunit
MAAHIPISALWEYSRNPNTQALSPLHQDHIQQCEDCDTVLLFCETSRSFDHLKKKLRECEIAFE